MIDTAVRLIECALALVLAVSLLVVVMTPKVREGLIVRVGLSCMCVGFFWIFSWLIEGVWSTDLIAAVRAMLLITSGIGLVVVGYPLRVLSMSSGQRHPLRRHSDWGDQTKFDEEDTSP